MNPSDGTIFVADGYGNSRVVAFNPEGVFRRMFGGVFGTGPKQINCAHNCAYAEVRDTRFVARRVSACTSQMLSCLRV